MLTKWDARFYHLALEVAMWSKDPDCQVGCVAVAPTKRQFTVGYNGYPKNYPDNQFSDKSIIVHAELNCILNAPVVLRDWHMYCTKAPCIDCAKAIATAGIMSLTCPPPYGSWADEQAKALELLYKLRITVETVKL